MYTEIIALYMKACYPNKWIITPYLVSVFWKNWFIGQKSLRNREKYNTLLQICKTCPNSTNQKIVDDFDSEDSDSTPLLENSITMDHCHESGAQPHRPQVSVITVVEFYACSGKIQ